MKPLNEVYLCPNLMFLASPWLRYIQFQTGHFPNFEQFEIDSHSATLVKSRLILCVYFNTLNKSVILLSFSKMLDCEKQSKPPTLDKSSGTTHRVWYKAFSMIQSTKIKNWIPQLISRLERVSLWIPFCNTFFDLSHKIKYAW